MSKFLRAIIFLLCAAMQAHAGPWHYIKTHKYLLGSDALVSGAIYADMQTSIWVQGHCSTCIETDPLLGQHPTPTTFHISALAFASASVAINHLAWHFAPESGGKFFGVAFLTVPITIIEANAAADNYHLGPTTVPKTIRRLP